MRRKRCTSGRSCAISPGARHDHQAAPGSRARCSAHSGADRMFASSRSASRGSISCVRRAQRGLRPRSRAHSPALRSAPVGRYRSTRRDARRAWLRQGPESRSRNRSRCTARGLEVRIEPLQTQRGRRVRAGAERETRIEPDDTGIGCRHRLVVRTDPDSLAKAPGMKVFEPLALPDPSGSGRTSMGGACAPSARASAATRWPGSVASGKSASAASWATAALRPERARARHHRAHRGV